MSAVLSRPPMDLRMAEGMLTFIDGAEDRQIWLAVGMALKSEYGDTAFASWDSWSQGAANYSAPACRSSWRGFKARASGYTMGTLIKFAKDGGYRFDRDDAPKPDLADMARRRAERAARVAAEVAERDRRAASAEDRALDEWRAAERTGTSAYAERKGIDAPESVRFLPAGQGGGLLVPMLRYDLPREQSLKGLQIIKDDGSKKFTPGMAKVGTACRLGLPVVGEPVFVVEGYATGMTVRMAMARRYPVYVAFDAYNLPSVVETIYQALPTCPIIICADDDWHTTGPGGLPNNVGRVQAQIAMDAVMEPRGPKDPGARLVVRTFPLFRKETARGPKDSDFNDLQRLEGLAEVTTQLETCLEGIDALRAYG